MSLAPLGDVEEQYEVPEVSDSEGVNEDNE